MITINGIKGVSVLITIGTYAGFAFQRSKGIGWRIIMGWICIGYYNLDVDAFLHHVMDKKGART